MNIDNFASLKILKENLEREADDSLQGVKEIKQKCLEAVKLIDDLRFKNNSAHVQLATRHALQYINKALFKIEAYFVAYSPVTKTSTVNINDICSPAQSGLEIILNLNY
jgi:hypothetical protein